MIQAHYRALTVQLFIHVVDNNKPLPKISILSAMNMLTAAWDKLSEATQNSHGSLLNDTDDPFKLLNEELETLEKEEKTPPQVNAETMIGCDEEHLTGDTKPPTDSDILAEFQPDDNELEEDEVLIDELPPKRPSKHELCHAIGMLQIFSLFVERDTNSFKSNLGNFQG